MNIPYKRPNPASINIWQAIVGVFAGYLLKDFAYAILDSKTMSSTVLINIGAMKILFIINILIYISLFSAAIITFQKDELMLKKIYINKVAYIDLKDLSTKTKTIGIGFLFTYGFLIASYTIFTNSFSIYQFILFILIWPVWMINYAYQEIIKIEVENELIQSENKGREVTPLNNEIIANNSNKLNKKVNIKNKRKISKL